MPITKPAIVKKGTATAGLQVSCHPKPALRRLKLRTNPATPEIKAIIKGQRNLPSNLPMRKLLVLLFRLFRLFRCAAARLPDFLAAGPAVRAHSGSNPQSRQDDRLEQDPNRQDYEQADNFHPLGSSVGYITV